MHACEKTTFAKESLIKTMQESRACAYRCNMFFSILLSISLKLLFILLLALCKIALQNSLFNCHSPN